VIALTVDASVAVKWFLAGTPDEPDSEKAISILLSARASDVVLLQPPHWRAEVAAVLARREPALALESIADLCRLPNVDIVDTDAMVLAATQIAIELGEHVFDTLYHAAALEHDAMLITADERYFRRARKRGAIALLRQYVTGSAGAVR